MITFKLPNLHFQGETEHQRDLCAHSPIHFQIDDTIISQESDGDWTVSAAALRLLRSVTKDHKCADSDKVNDQQMFPCCGHFMLPAKDDSDDEVWISGCSNGIDIEVIHVDKDVVVTFEDSAFKIPQREWAQAALDFSQQVMDFFAQSEAKAPYDDMESQGYHAFISEWLKRHETVRLLLLE